MADQKKKENENKGGKSQEQQRQHGKTDQKPSKEQVKKGSGK